uniref:Uncharacterized protein n=2 Tax=unclassified Caudoviricetes TaxID=2788787 RepID=A0AAU8HXR3_9CAUD
MTRLVSFSIPISDGIPDFCERMENYMEGYNPEFLVFDKGLNGSHIEIIFEGPLTDHEIKYFPSWLSYMAAVKVRLIEE